MSQKPLSLVDSTQVSYLLVSPYIFIRNELKMGIALFLLLIQCQYPIPTSCMSSVSPGSLRLRRYSSRIVRYVRPLCTRVYIRPIFNSNPCHRPLFASAPRFGEGSKNSAELLMYCARPVKSQRA